MKIEDFDTDSDSSLPVLCVFHADWGSRLQLKRESREGKLENEEESVVWVAQKVRW